MNPQTSEPADVDVLIVGSGPVGAAFARRINQMLPAAEILMVELGPQLTPEPGLNLRNLPDDDQRADARRRSQGRHGAAVGGRGIPGGRMVEGTITARQGTHLVTPGATTDGGMPAAAVSTCVGGQGVHWTGATPRPVDTERIPFIGAQEWDALADQAEQLLGASHDIYARTALGDAMIERLAKEFAADLPAGRPVRVLPVAAQRGSGGQLIWGGTDTVLGPLVTGTQPETFQLLSETLCRRLIVSDGRISAAELVTMRTHKTRLVRARVVVVAADAFRTPQLLWASGIRPVALGHYLTEHPLVFGIVALAADLTGPTTDDNAPGDMTGGETPAGVFNVPFAEPRHPFHAQVMVMRENPLLTDTASLDRGNGFAMIGWGCRKQPNFTDAVTFSDTETDENGMPKLYIHYTLGAQDRHEIEAATQHVRRAADVLGEWLPDGEPRLMPAGSSLHYQGTIRMGVAEDNTSVCDSYSQVWGTENLFVGGNGTIPTATACNPTLTSVALALRACQRIVAILAK